MVEAFNTLTWTELVVGSLALGGTLWWITDHLAGVVFILLLRIAFEGDPPTPRKRRRSHPGALSIVDSGRLSLHKERGLQVFSGRFGNPFKAAGVEPQIKIKASGRLPPLPTPTPGPGRKVES